MIVKLSELSGILGITPRQVNKLAKAKIIPRARKGEYELAGAVQGYINYIKDGDADKKTTMHDEQTRLIRAQRKKIEIAIDKELGRLIPDDEFQKFMERLIIAARTNFLLIENETPRIRSAKDAPEAREIIRKRIYAILDDLSKTELIPGDEEEDEGEPETLGSAAEPVRRRVGRKRDVALS